MRNKEVLDIGCGLGLTLICLSLLGCKKAVGIDISEDMINCFQKLFQFFPALNVSAKLGDWLLMNCEEETFDVVILKEAISHIRDTQSLLEKISKVLRPKGVLSITDSNNDLFFMNKLKRKKLWKKVECGPFKIDQARHRRVDRLPFFDARVSIIRELYPSLDKKTLKMLAQKTQGMYGSEIARAVNEFVATGEIRQKPSFPYRNPYTGEFPELGINPLKLASTLKHKGFECKLVPLCYPPEPVYGGRNVIRNQIRSTAKTLLNRFPQYLLPFVWPTFHLMAVKSG